MKNCSKCGQENLDTDKFCKGCGASLEDITKVEEPTVSTEDTQKSAESKEEATVLINEEPTIPNPAPMQPGMAPMQPGMMPQQPGMEPMQPGMAPMQPGMTPMQPGMMPQQPGMAPMQPGMAPQKPVKQKKPKKKLSGGALAGIIIGVIVVLAGIGVGVFFIIKSLSPDEEDIKAALPEEITSYTLNGEEYESTVKSVIIEDKNSKTELECEIVLEDDFFERTVYYELEFEKEDGEWVVDKFEATDDAEFKVKDSFIQFIAVEEGYEEITNIVNNTDKGSTYYMYDFDVDSETNYASVKGTGTVEFYIDNYADDDEMPDYYYYSFVDDYDMECEWNIAGSYIEDSDSVTMGVTITDLGDGDYQVDFVSSKYGTSSDEAYFYSYSDSAELYVYTESSTYDYIDYYLYFSHDGFELEVYTYDGSETLTMKPGEFSQQQEESDFNFEDYIK